MNISISRTFMYLGCEYRNKNKKKKTSDSTKANITKGSLVSHSYFILFLSHDFNVIKVE